jgi:hypothetical protein
LAAKSFVTVCGNLRSPVKNRPRHGANHELLQTVTKRPNAFLADLQLLTSAFVTDRKKFSVLSHWLPGMDSNHD